MNLLFIMCGAFMDMLESKFRYLKDEKFKRWMLFDPKN